MIPSEDIAVVVPVGTKSDALASLQFLPEGYTTVPHLSRDLANGPAVDVLLRAGFKVEGAPDPGGNTHRGTAPVAGSVVAQGSTVTLLLEDEVTLTPEQATSAARIVQDFIRDNPTYDVLSGWAKAESGTVGQQNVGQCTSGELLRIGIFGALPIPVSGPPGSSSDESDPRGGAATEVALLTADAETGEVCLQGVGRRSSEPDPDATMVYAEPDARLIDAFVAFAQDPTEATAAEVSFASLVLLGLGETLVANVSARDIARAEYWGLDGESFRGYAGPFSALATLSGRQRDDLDVVRGPHPHCAGAPIPAPEGFEDYQRISVQPRASLIDSCLQWFSVDLFLDSSGSVAGVTLDLWEP